MRSLSEMRYELATRTTLTTNFVNSIYSRELSQLYGIEIKFTFGSRHNSQLHIGPGVFDILVEISFDCDGVTRVRQNGNTICHFSRTLKVNKKWEWVPYWRNVGPDKYDITKSFIRNFKKKYPSRKYYIGIRSSQEFIEVSTGTDNGERIYERMQLSPLEAAVCQILMKYPLDHLHLAEIYDKYDRYPIMEYYHSTMTFLMIRWFRNSVLSIIPKDVVRVIAKEFWNLRCVPDC